MGHPRSGTGFMAELFQQFGYDVGHEKMGKDGISSWMFAVCDKQVFVDTTLNRKDYKFDYVITNVRHPIDIIASTYYTEGAKSLAYRKKFVPLEGLNEIEMAAKSVLEWYKLIELQKPNLHISIDKSPEKHLLQFLRKFEGNKVQPVKEKIRKVNERSHPDITFSFIQANCNKDIVLELVNFCGLYNYDISNR